MFQTHQVIHDHYQLEQRLGHTVAGRQTWLATDRQSNNQAVVIKFLVFNPEFNWDDLKLFEREAQVLANLDHPQIPQYRDFFVADTDENTALHWWALVQDFVPGNSLQDLLDRGHKFEPAKIRSIALEVLEILTYLHALSPPVLHRDIKPSNLIVGDDDKVYLIDFGAVQDQAKVTGMTFTIVGTTGYAPMEQFWGRAIPASDLYGLGMTLIHLLTGVVPSELPQRNLQIQFTDKVSLEPAFASWLEKMVEPALEYRYRSARAAHKDLQRGSIRQKRKPTPNWVLSIVDPHRAKFVKPLFSTMRVDKRGDDLTILPSRKVHTVASGITFNSERKRAVNLLLIMVGMVMLAALIKLIDTRPLLGLLILTATIVGGVGATLILNIPKSIGLRFVDRHFEIFQISDDHKGQTTTQVLYSDRVHRIRFVSTQEYSTQNLQGQPQIHNRVVIRTKETYTLPWLLSEEECLWIIQEIHN